LEDNIIYKHVTAEAKRDEVLSKHFNIPLKISTSGFKLLNYNSCEGTKINLKINGV
jgi:hypothetical protein